MNYNFTGSTRTPRKINLGNAAGSSSAQTALTARQQREQRELRRRREASALLIQAAWRGSQVMAETRRALRTKFDQLVAARSLAADQDGRVLAELTRIVAFALNGADEGDRKRLEVWCRLALGGNGKAAEGTIPPLFTPFTSKDLSVRRSWPTLLTLAGKVVLSQFARYPTSPEAVLECDVLKMLFDSQAFQRYTGTESSNWLRTVSSALLRQGLHEKIRAHLLAIDPELKTSPTLPSAIALALAPFRVYSQSTTSSDRSAAMQSFVTHIMTIPLLTSRIPITALTTLAAGLPFDEMILAANDLTRQRVLSVSPFLLANVLALVSKRVQHMNSAVLAAYLGFLTIALSALPPAAFISEKEISARRLQRANEAQRNTVDLTIDSDSEDDEAGQATTVREARARVAAASGAGNDVTMADATSETVARRGSDAVANSTIYPLDGRTFNWLQLLVSPAHLSALLTVSSRFPNSTRLPFAGFLVSLFSAWPAKKDDVINTVMYGFTLSSTGNKGKGVAAARGAAGASGGGLLREIWRGWIRGGPLSRKISDRERMRETLAAVKDSTLGGDWAAFVLLAELYSRSLLTMGDDEFFPPSFFSDSASSTTAFTSPVAASGSSSAARNPLSLDEVISFSGLLRNLAFALYWQEGQLDMSTDRVGGDGGLRMSLDALRKLVTKLLQQIHARDSRHPFVPNDHWLMVSEVDVQSFIQTVLLEDQVIDASESPEDGGTHRGTDTEVEDEEELYARIGDSGPLRRRHIAPPKPRMSARTLALISPRLGVLNNIPFTLPFEMRVEIFRQFIRNDAKRLGLTDRMFSYTRRKHRATVRRGHIAEDGYAHLNALGPALKGPIEITFIDQFGQPEAGIDGGGLFKEFLTSVIKEVFDTDRGLWKANAGHELYPNPHSYARDHGQLSWYTFIGRVLGKAIYEGILVDVKFAGFFLSKWLGKQGYLDDLALLHSLDPELYKGLIYLKNYSGDVERDLSLNFTITDEEFGVSKTIDLVPNGSKISVTRENRLHYVYLTSHYRLTTQIAPQCDAFFAGLTEMIDPRWLRMFNREELRVLVSGTEDPIDIEDLKANTEYGGYHELDETIRMFWEVAATFDQQQRKALLKYVTSCGSPPLLGFGQLFPKFAIRLAGDDESRLPTASACVNLLKLPRYRSKKVLREKLLYAITSGAGFDLS